jgi:hypothetical protein
MKSNHHEGHEDHEGLKQHQKEADHEEKRRMMFTVDPKINFSEKIDFFVFLRALRGENFFKSVVIFHFFFLPLMFFMVNKGVTALTGSMILKVDRYH